MVQFESNAEEQDCSHISRIYYMGVFRLPNNIFALRVLRVLNLSIYKYFDVYAFLVLLGTLKPRF